MRNLHIMCIYPLSLYLDDELKQYDMNPISVNEYSRDTGYNRSINPNLMIAAHQGIKHNYIWER